MKSIEITFRADGTTEVKAVGYQGSGCQQATKPYEDELGTVTSDQKLPEFYQQQTGQQKQTV